LTLTVTVTLGSPGADTVMRTAPILRKHVLAEEPPVSLV